VIQLVIVKDVATHPNFVRSLFNYLLNTYKSNEHISPFKSNDPKLAFAKTFSIAEFRQLKLLILTADSNLTPVIYNGTLNK